MDDLMARMNRNNVELSGKTDTQASNDTKDLQVKDIPGSLYCTTMKEYQEVYLNNEHKTGAYSAGKGLMQVILSKENATDIKFICSVTGVSIKNFVNSVLSEHIKAHSTLLQKLSRPAVSWSQRKKNMNHDN